MSEARGAAESLAQRVEMVRARIAEAARRAGREAHDVTLVAASKRMPPEVTLAALEAGIDHFGENYVQEAAGKIGWLAQHGSRPATWHLIGRLQRNKARDAVRLFQTVETVDRPSLARALAGRAEEAGQVLPVLLQVNLSDEPQKAGAAPADVEALLALCAGLAGLRVEGLMTIPAAHADPECSRPVFARLRELGERLRTQAGGDALNELSMGMSSDYTVAVEEGATRVRIGTALFGPRPA